jgi:O-antigen ligase
MENYIKEKFTYWGIGSIALGVFVSVTIPSLFHIFVLVPALIVCFESFKREELKLPKSSYFLIALVLWGYIANIYNFDRLDNPIRSFGKLKYFIYAVICIPLFKKSFETYINPYRAKKILNIFLFTIICAAGYGLIKYYPQRISGFTNTMRYGYGTSMVLSVMLGIFLHRKKLMPLLSKRLFYFAILMGFLGLFGTKTRGALLGLTCSLPFIVYFYNKTWGKRVFVITFGAILFVAINILFFGGSTKFRLLDKLGSDSNLKRYSQFESSFRTTLNNPIFGVGVNNFSSLCPQIKKDLDIFWPNYCKEHEFLNCKFHETVTDQYCSHSHNIFLETSVNMGFVGGVFLLIWFLLWGWELFKMKNLLAILIIPFWVNMAVAGQFENIFDANNSFLIFFLYPLSFVNIPGYLKINQE